MSTENSSKVTIHIHVTPGAKNNAVTGFKEGEVRIKVTAPPVDGKANDALIEFLSTVLDIRKNALYIIKGKSSRRKLVSIEGLAPTEIEARLSASVQ